jgi:hypothetical protein
VDGGLDGERWRSVGREEGRKGGSEREGGSEKKKHRGWKRVREEREEREGGMSEGGKKGEEEKPSEEGKVTIPPGWIRRMGKVRGTVFFLTQSERHSMHICGLHEQSADDPSEP